MSAMSIDLKQLSVRRLAGNLAAEVEGFNIARDSADPHAMQVVKSAFLEHGVVLFRNQQLDPAEHVAFAAQWGTPDVAGLATPHLADHPEVVLITTDNGRGRNEAWHADSTFKEVPPAMSLLLARDLPNAGGDTAFANQYLAYERLSPAMQKLLDPLRAVHTGAYLTALLGNAESFDKEVPHPVVRTHPETGRKSLFVNSLFTTRFEGMTEDESRPLLNWLFEHSTQIEFTFRHMWREGDLLMWDNRCVQHCAIKDYDDQHRMMHRVTIPGTEPPR
jgi:taurine dioxygenase